MEKKHGQKYYVTIEGTEYEWIENTITLQQIRELASIPADQTIVEDTVDGDEITLKEEDIIHLKPGHRYGVAPKYHRGL